MCAITRLKALNRRASRTRVEIDGEPWADLSTEVVLKHALCKGMVLDSAQRRALLAADAFVRARRAAAILLKTRPRAVAEMRLKLRQRDYDEETIETIVAYFSEKGDLDDARFARTFASHQFKTKTIGTRKVALMLRRLGVAERHVEAALEAEPKAREDEQTALARRFIERRVKRLRSEDPPRRRKKLYAALTRAGFDPDIFHPLMKEALEEIAGEDHGEYLEDDLGDGGF